MAVVVTCAALSSGLQHRPSTRSQKLCDCAPGSHRKPLLTIRCHEERGGEGTQSEDDGRTIWRRLSSPLAEPVAVLFCLPPSPPRGPPEVSPAADSNTTTLNRP